MENPFSYDSPFCHVEYRAADWVVFLQWKKRCCLEDYRQPARFALKLLRENAGSDLIIDAREGFEDEPEDLTWGFTVLVPAMAQTQCRNVVFILREAPELDVEMDRWTLEFSRYFTVGHVTGYPAAIFFLMSQRAL